jgi:sugar phosphate isomerase/epimerase
VSGVRIACQTYTWEMLGGAWHGEVTDLLDWIAAAGYEGVEISNTMIGAYAECPGEFRHELKRRGLTLAAYAYATTGFTDPDRLDQDLAGARQAIALLRRFPGARLGLGGAGAPTPDLHRAALDRAICFYNRVGRMAAAAQVPVYVHPHSHHGSLLESAANYQYLLDRLEPGLVDFGPDTGHIVRGGQDLLPCLRAHLPRIVHLHVKDVNCDGEWVGLGQGLCDFPAALAFLEEAGYCGWVVAEEESEAARCDGVAAINGNRAYLRSLGY